MSAYQGNKLVEATKPEPTFQEQVLSKLTDITDRLENINDRLDAIDVRISDLELDSGDGFERDTY